MTATLLTSAEARPTTDKQDFQYDVFISYHGTDEAWVNDHLIPRLNKADVHCADEYDYRLGPPTLTEMERCVTRSRWTLLIVTRAYLEDSWDNHLAVMTQSYGLDRKRWRTIVLRLEAGLKLPANLDMLSGIDLSRDDEAQDEKEWGRLIRGLNEGLEGSAPAVRVQSPPSGAYAVRKGLDALIHLLASPAVRRTVDDFQLDFRTCCEQIEILGDYKALHDQLHVLQFQCFNNIAFAALGFPDGPGTYEMLSDAQYKLEQIVSESAVISERGKVAPQSWVAELTRLQEPLAKACDELDPGPLELIIRQLVRVLSKDPSKINDRLNQTASMLRLSQLGQALKAIRDVMNGPELDPEKVRIFDNGLEGLTNLRAGLTVAINDHNRWQEFDTDLRLLENALKDEDYDPTWDWTNLCENMGGLYAGPEDWAVRLRADASAVAQALEAKNGKRIRHKFRDFRAKAGMRFYEIDRELLRYCGELREFGGPLSMLMEFTECAH